MKVFLHGWGMNSLVFENFVQQHFEHEEVLLLDLPSYSSATVSEFAEQVALLKSQIPVGSHVFGWSLGGLYAIALAHQFPQYVSQLTLLGSTPCFMQRPDFSCALSDGALDRFSQQLLVSREKTIDRFLLLQLYGEKQAKRLARELKGLLLKKTQPTEAVLEQGLLFLKSLDLREELFALDMDVQFILGAKDQLVPVQLADYLGEAGQGIQVDVLEDAGHIAFLTHSDAVYRCIA